MHPLPYRKHALEPNLWATATLMASSDSLSPTAVIGGACSQHQSVERPQQEVWLYPRQMELWKRLDSFDLLQLNGHGKRF